MKIKKYFNSEKKKYECPICGKEYSHRKTFSPHLKAHDEAYEERHLKCNVCLESFACPQSLRRHQKKCLSGVLLENLPQLPSNNDKRKEFEQQTNREIIDLKLQVSKLQMELKQLTHIVADLRTQLGGDNFPEEADVEYLIEETNVEDTIEVKCSSVGVANDHCYVHNNLKDEFIDVEEPRD